MFKKWMPKLLAVLLGVSLFAPKVVKADVNVLIPVTEDVVFSQSEARKFLDMDNAFRQSGAWIWNQDNATKQDAIVAEPLSYNYSMEEIAMQRAAEAIAYRDHTRPNGTKFTTVTSSDGKTSTIEILAWLYGKPDIKSAFDMWLEEKTDYAGQIHRRVLLNNTVKSMGAAVASYGQITVYVQEFSVETHTGTPTTAFDGTRTMSFDVQSSFVDSYKIDADTTKKHIVRVGDVIDLNDVKGELFIKPVQTFAPAYSVDFKPTLAPADDASASIVSVVGTSVSGKKIGNAKLSISVANGVLMTFTDTLSVEVVKGESLTMYRLYNPNSGEHFYTSNKEERDDILDAGWNDEGIAWYAPMKSNSPVYRLYNENGGEHHYTLSIEERDSLISAGWKDEGIGWYSSDNQDIPLYRLYNSNAYANNHHYTTSPQEQQDLVDAGWTYEGIAWYGLIK